MPEVTSNSVEPELCEGLIRLQESRRVHIIVTYWQDLRDQLETNPVGQTRPPLRWAQEASTSLTKIAEPFNATNNTSDGYKTICTDRWEHNKSSITRQEALPKEVINVINANHNC